MRASSLAKLRTWCMFNGMRMFQTLACCSAAVLFSSTSLAQPRVFINVFDFDYSINLPGEPVVDAVVEPGTRVIWVLWHDLHDTVACRWPGRILGISHHVDHRHLGTRLHDPWRLQLLLLPARR